MTGDQYSRALARLGLSNRGFCRNVIGVSEQTGRRWISAGAPRTVAAFLWLAAAQNLTAETLHEIMSAHVQKKARPKPGAERRK